MLLRRGRCRHRRDAVDLIAAYDTALAGVDRLGVIVNNMVGMAFAAGGAEGAAEAVEAALDHYLRTPAEGRERLRLPGDVEQESRETLSRIGVPQAAETWEAILACGREAELDEGPFRRAELGRP